jgi:4'-phosphopantetheinyl transferase
MSTFPKEKMDYDFKGQLRTELILMDDEVHIWSACLLANEDVTKYFTSILSKDECERAKEFRFFRDQKRFIVARAILRFLLSKYLNFPPKRIEILYGPWGKPVLSGKKHLHFNLSHSGNYALYAFARKYELGIDLEYIDHRLELESMVLSLFSSDEINHWKKLGSKEKTNFFFRFWACKEAFLKASGKGWLINEIENHLLKYEMKNPYYFEWIPGYASALFINGPILKPVYCNWDYASLDL